DTKIKDMPPEGVHALLSGTGGEKLEMTRETDRGTGTYSTEIEGIINNLERRFRETNSEWMKEEIQGVMTGVECPDCHGDRLTPTSLAVTVGGVNISKFTQMSVREELDFINGIQLTEREHMIADGILKEIRERLGFLQNVG
ncbi:excinuclease ABC subunit UvrA, partial [Ruthenibacterium lactatiformans]|nr:excinuclease ABC subunit UvrA [Ruthenibacterium lactatiformans]